MVNWFPSMFPTIFRLRSITTVCNECVIRPSSGQKFIPNIPTLFHVWQRSGQEMPPTGIRLPRLRIFAEHFRAVMLGIESDAEQNQVSAHSILKALLQLAEVVCQPQAIVWQGAARIYKSDSDDLAPELGKCHGTGILVN